MHEFFHSKIGRDHATFTRSRSIDRHTRECYETGVSVIRDGTCEDNDYNVYVGQHETFHNVAIYVKQLTPSREMVSARAPAPAPVPAPSPSAFHELEDLRSILDGWMFTDDFAVMIGNTQYGTIFNYTHGNFSIHTRVGTASTSKWPLAMTLAGAVTAWELNNHDPFLLLSQLPQ